MVAVALVFLLRVRVRRSHRSDVATIADGQTVRRLGDGRRSVIGGHCQLLPVMVSVALVFLLRVRVRRSHRSEVATIADVKGCALLRVAGCALSLVRLDCQLLPPLPVSW